MGDIEFDETMRWDVIASVPEEPKDKDRERFRELNRLIETAKDQLVELEAERRELLAQHREGWGI
jgi:hypothetical protein